MLIVHEKFKRKTATDRDFGDINDFLLNLLIEVVTENYRQTLHEHLWENEDGLRSQIHLDPPLRANERVISGLFSQAISKASSRSRPEARINRTERGSEEDFDDSSSAGRIDYLAWTNGRAVGVELKSGLMNYSSNAPTLMLQKRWENVWRQAQEAQNYLREISKEDGRAYPSPVTIALMVVLGTKNIKRCDISKVADEVDAKQEDFVEALKKMSDPKPQFIATYTFPEEFRGVSRRKRGIAKFNDEECAYTPYVGFIGRVAINSTSN